MARRTDTAVDGAVAFGAFLGSISHIALDSVMHSDMQPAWPFATSNPLLHAIGVESLHLVCLALGVVGFIGWVGTSWLTRSRSGT